jgi:branched-chain amino acid transport system substrate-binding protein
MYSFILALILLTATNFSFAKECINVGILGEFKSANSRASFAYGTEMLRGVNISLNLNTKKCVEIFEIDINNSISNIDGLIRKNHKEHNITYFIGLGTSSQVHAAIKTVNDENVLLLSPTATDDAILDLSKKIILMSPTNKVMINKIIKEIRRLNLKNAAIIYGANDVYSKSMAESFKKIAKEEKINVVYEKEIRTGHNTKIEGIDIQKVNSSDFIFLPIYELEVVKVIGHLHSLGIKKGIVGTDSWGSNSKLLSILPKVVFSQILFSINSYIPSEKNLQKNIFNIKYKEKYNAEPLDMSAFSYDAMNLILLMTEKCKSIANPSTCLESLGTINTSTGKMKFSKKMAAFDREIFFRKYE